MNESRSTALTRRRLLASGATVGLIATAGCLGTREGDVPEPVVTHESVEEDWRLVDSSDSVAFEEDVGPVTVRALERTVVYEYVDMAEAAADAFDADGSPVTFFAARIDLRPALDQLPGGFGRDRLMEEVRAAAEAAFRSQLAGSGVSDVERTGSGETSVESGHTATTSEFVARFDIGGDVPLPDGGTTTIDGTAEMNARLAVWHDGTDVLISGGAHPAEPLSDVIDRSIDAPVDGETLIDETVDDSDVLTAEPSRFEDAVDALIPSVE